MKLIKKIKTTFYRYLEFFVYSRNFISSIDVKLHKKSLYRGLRAYGNVSIDEGCKIIDGVVIKTASSITIDRFTSINGPNTDIISQINPIKIGSFCSIARNVTIQEFNHNYTGVTTYPILQNIFKKNKKMDIYSNGAIEIGNDVWIGTQCVILSGAKIGNGAIVAANSTVSSVVPPYAIVAGSPAKIIKYRHPQEIINKLLEIKWWTWSVEKIKKNKEFFEGEITLEKFNHLKE